MGTNIHCEFFPKIYQKWLITMVIKKYHLLMTFAFIFTMAVTMVVVSTPAVAAPAETAIETDAADASLEAPDEALSGGEWNGDGNNLNLNILRVGDIISCHGVMWMTEMLEWAIGYSHSAIYVGNGQIVEAWENGVRYAPASMIKNADDVTIERVYTSTSKKQAAVNFMKAQVGKPYDFIWLTYIGGKQVYGSSYYCSELVWAGYKTQGIDIDRRPGWSWSCGYSVSPQEIHDDGNTYSVAYAS